MVNGVQSIQIAEREGVREQNFKHIWKDELDDIFEDVAGYYDKANYVASLGLWGQFRKNFLATIDLQPGQRALDVCAGTNAIGIALIKKQPDLQVFAMDRSEAMQAVGRKNTTALGFNIDSTIGDVHKLPYPDNHFDVVTIQYASRHLRLLEVFAEIKRVLKPGGHFYHCDMLRPANRLVEVVHYAYLRVCLTVTGWIFSSGKAAFDSREYFMDALSMFYSAEELCELLRHVGFQDVSCKTMVGGLVAFHKAAKE